VKLQSLFPKIHPGLCKSVGPTQHSVDDDKTEQNVYSASSSTAPCNLTSTSTSTSTSDQSNLLGGYTYTDSSTTTTPTTNYPVGNGPSIWTTGTYIAGAPETVDFKKLKCRLPESTLEKLMMIGLPKSKKVLRDRIKEAFTQWCNTQELDVTVFPMLLAACMVMLNDGEEETTKKEEK